MPENETGAETENTTPETGTDTGAVTPETETGETPEQAAAKWKAMARKHEADAKRNRDAAEKLAKIEDANKSEVERATARAAEAEERAAKLERQVNVSNALAAAKLDPKYAGRLVGETAEELLADAKALAKDVGTVGATTDFGAGKRGPAVGESKSQITREQLSTMTPKEIVKAKAEGRLDHLFQS